MHLDIYKKNNKENDWTLKLECVEQHFIGFVVTQIAHLDLGFGWTNKPSEGIVFVPIRFLMSEMADIIDVLRVYIVTAVTELLYGL